MPPPRTAIGRIPRTGPGRRPARPTPAGAAGTRHSPVRHGPPDARARQAETGEAQQQQEPLARRHHRHDHARQTEQGEPGQIPRLGAGRPHRLVLRSRRVHDARPVPRVSASARVTASSRSGPGLLLPSMLTASRHSGVLGLRLRAGGARGLVPAGTVAQRSHAEAAHPTARPGCRPSRRAGPGRAVTSREPGPSPGHDVPFVGDTVGHGESLDVTGRVLAEVGQPAAVLVGEVLGRQRFEAGDVLGADAEALADP